MLSFCANKSRNSKQARHRYNSALKVLEQKRREVEQGIRQAFFDVTTDINRIKALGRAVVSAQVSYESNEAGFKVGRRSSVDVLLAIEELFEAKRNYSETRHNYVVNTLRMKQITGQLSEKDIIHISQWLK